MQATKDDSRNSPAPMVERIVLGFGVAAIALGVAVLVG